MIHFVVFLVMWLISSIMNVAYMVYKERSPEGKYLAVVFLPVINVLYSVIVVLHFKNFINPIKTIKSVLIVIKDIINVFKEH